MPILYSFRRCPWAMRARVALAAASIKCVIREVLLENKPAALLQASAKGTVPVLVLPDGRVIDESLEIMQWALDKHYPEQWLPVDEATQETTAAMIASIAGPFLFHLVRTKYASRYPGANPASIAPKRASCLSHLNSDSVSMTIYLVTRRLWRMPPRFPWCDSLLTPMQWRLPPCRYRRCKGGYRNGNVPSCFIRS